METYDIYLKEGNDFANKGFSLKDKAKVIRMAGDDPNIIFTGFVSGKLLEEIYSNAYVYVLPSKLEGMPLSLLEAMSYGNCVIGSDIAEIADVVEDKAILFKKANVEDLKEKLQMLYDDDIPVNVAINEAVELAKSYGSDDNAASFVNGVLAKLV